MAFKIGDKVEWTSQAGGSWSTKRGEVIEVVPPRMEPAIRLKGMGYPRDHESYIVRTYEIQRYSGVKKESRLYWPRVAALELVQK